MIFPEHNILPADKDSWLSKEVNQKLIEFTPFAMCSFYEGFQVLQIQGIESQEYFFGNYFNGEYKGYIYLGTKFSQLDAAKVCELYMPKKWDEIFEYFKKYGDKIYYSKYPDSQYAWIFKKILKKTE
jgi:hypothetical protein